MLTRRIIPCFDVDNGRVVKGVSFVELRDAGEVTRGIDAGAWNRRLIGKKTMLYVA